MLTTGRRCTPSSTTSRNTSAGSWSQGGRRDQSGTSTKGSCSGSSWVALGEALHGSDANWPARYFNIGGSAWTQYPHYDRRGNVFWRLDSWKPLRPMVDTNAVGGERALAAWGRLGWRVLGSHAAVRLGASRVSAGQKQEGRERGDHRGVCDARSCLQREGLDGCVQKVAPI